MGSCTCTAWLPQSPKSGQHQKLGPHIKSVCLRFNYKYMRVYVCVCVCVYIYTHTSHMYICKLPHIKLDNYVCVYILASIYEVERQVKVLWSLIWMWKSWRSALTVPGITTPQGVGERAALPSFSSQRESWQADFHYVKRIWDENSRGSAQDCKLFSCSWSSSSVYRIFVRRWRNKQIWFISMQADGLVVEIVKRFTERLHQIKDITELKGSKRPYWSSSQWLTTLHFLINEKDNSTPWIWSNQGGRRQEHNSFVQRSANVNTETGDIKGQLKHVLLWGQWNHELGRIKSHIFRKYFHENESYLSFYNYFGVQTSRTFSTSVFQFQEKFNDLKTNHTYQENTVGSEFMNLRINLKVLPMWLTVRLGDHLALYKNILFHENAQRTAGKHYQWHTSELRCVQPHLSKAFITTSLTKTHCFLKAHRLFTFNQQQHY